MSDTAQVVPGMSVEVLTANGEWIAATTVSGCEGTYDRDGRKIHDFPVVWVRTKRHPDRIPWPADAIRPVPRDTPTPQDA